MQISTMQAADWVDVARIYAAGIAAGDATFATAGPDWQTWAEGHLPYGRLTARNEAGEIVGWAALAPVSGRCVYGGVAEVSVYVAAEARGQGVGNALLAALVDASEENGIWTLQAGIFPENEASVAIHRKCGFRVVGRRERLAQQYGRWRDVLLMERRSQVVGE